jgi:hypothetical protein
MSFSVKSSESFKNSDETQRHLADTLKKTTFRAAEATDINVFLEIIRNCKKHGDIWRSAQNRTGAPADMNPFALWKVKNTRASDKHSENNDFSSNRSASRPPYTNRFAISCEKHAFFEQTFEKSAQTDFCKKITEFPPVGKVVLLGFLDFFSRQDEN